MSQTLEELKAAVIAELPPEERLRGLSPEERLKGLSIDEILSALGENARQQLRERMKQQSPKENE
ncbi:MAG: hypothetical protein KY475_14165 [Planctomycetes bacterium]|nr:hypothetical protein [Planctomycetota bacterium]